MAREATRGDRTPRPAGPDPVADLDLDLAALAKTGPGPYRVQAELPIAWIASVLAHTDAEVSRDGLVALEVTSIGGGGSVLVRGTLDVAFAVPCARCLEPATVGTLARWARTACASTSSAASATRWRTRRAASGPTRTPRAPTSGRSSALASTCDPWWRSRSWWPIPSGPCAPGASPAVACACTAARTSTSRRLFPARAPRAGRTTPRSRSSRPRPTSRRATRKRRPSRRHETPWQAALRGLQISDESGTVPPAGPGRKKPRN
jgi:hypothetical protein